MLKKFNIRKPLSPDSGKGEEVGKKVIFNRKSSTVHYTKVLLN